MFKGDLDSNDDDFHAPLIPHKPKRINRGIVTKEVAAALDRVKHRGYTSHNGLQTVVGCMPSVLSHKLLVLIWKMQLCLVTQFNDWYLTQLALTQDCISAHHHHHYCYCFVVVVIVVVVVVVLLLLQV